VPPLPIKEYDEPFGLGWANLGYGQRTARVALRLGREKELEVPGIGNNIYRRISHLLCWDSAMVVAWLAKGIDLVPPPNQGTGGVFQALGRVQYNHYNMLFKNPLPVNGAAAITGIPEGAFVGFVGPQGLEHVMIYVGNGLAAGSNNGSIFENLAEGGWEVLDLNYFFNTSKKLKNGTRMVYEIVFGQTI
jgi:hypothetical protein